MLASSAWVWKRHQPPSGGTAFYRPDRVACPGIGQQREDPVVDLDQGVCLPCTHTSDSYALAWKPGTSHLTEGTGIPPSPTP